MDGGVTDPAIAGVVITELRQIADERGAVLHMLRNDPAAQVPFGECYFSEIVPGAIKAWKKHRLQTQNLAVPSGRIKLVVFDDRRDSPSRGMMLVRELGRPDAYARVRIPPGVWYGFACVGHRAALVANCADRPHEPGDGESRPLDDSAIPYRWIDGAPTART
jgi:dTDP-4-dehydrorhamnose 3,5-epimerase